MRHSLLICTSEASEVDLKVISNYVDLTKKVVDCLQFSGPRIYLI